MKDLTDIEQRMLKVRPKGPSPELSRKILIAPQPEKITRTYFWKLAAAILIMVTISWREYENSLITEMIDSSIIAESHPTQMSVGEFDRDLHENE